MTLVETLLGNWLLLGCLTVVAIFVIAALVMMVRQPKLVYLVYRNLHRSVVRTLLTCWAVMVLVFVITLIWTVVHFLDVATTEKAKDLKLIVTEKWQLPSQMPATHADYLNPKSSKFILESGDVEPNGFMTWSFYAGSTNPKVRSFDTFAFFFVMNPDHIIPMMDDLGDFDPKLVKKLKNTRQGCLMGPERMARLNLQVGSTFKIYSFNYKEIDLEFTIVGALPEGRYSQAAIMNLQYFEQAMNSYADKYGPHPLDERRLNLIWLRVKDRETFTRVKETIETAKEFKDRPVKCETQSSGIGPFLDGYRDFIWLIRWGLVPGSLIAMVLVVAIAITITVRERHSEMAVLKVLGYTPGQIMWLVLGESLLMGAVSGFLASLTTLAFFNTVWGGLPFQIAFFPVFTIPAQSLVWGAALGIAAAFLGSFYPAWSARSIKVSEVFAKVA